MSTRTLLTGALDLLEPRATRFTKGTLARNSTGEKVMPTSPYASCWCAIGALLHIARTDRIPGAGPLFDAVELLDRVAIEEGYTTAFRLSDARGRLAVLTLYRRALARLDTEGPPTRADTNGSTT